MLLKSVREEGDFFERLDIFDIALSLAAFLVIVATKSKSNSFGSKIHVSKYGSICVIYALLVVIVVLGLFPS